MIVIRTADNIACGKTFTGKTKSSKSYIFFHIGREPPYTKEYIWTNLLILQLKT